jgi:hypothetical protein
MKLVRLAIASLVATAAPALADGFVPITDRDRFVELLDSRVLKHPVYGIRLNVTPDGRISGSALGWAVTGTWNWQDGYFCRQMEWSGTPIPFNCQLVEASADKSLRFTVDKGAGDAATFRIQ